ncbi:unnamed protein product, partial [Meganyctiphanes norvegica]
FISDAKPPLRNGDFGTEGREIELITNFFPVEIKDLDVSQKIKDLSIDDSKVSKGKGGRGRRKGNHKKEIIPSGQNTEFVHYHVVIKECRKERSTKAEEFVDVDDQTKFPYGFSKRKRMEIFETMKKSIPAVFNKSALAYDSRNNAVGSPDNPALSNRDGTQWEVEVNGVNNRKKKYLVVLTPVNRHTLKEVMDELKGASTQPAELTLTATQMMDIMFRHNSSIKYLQYGRNLFFPTTGEFGRPTDTGEGMESVVGFFGSLRPAQWKNGSLLLNVDVAHAEFYKEQPIIDFIKENLHIRTGVPNDILKDTHRKKIEKELSGIKVRATHAQPRTYRVNKVLPKGADTLTFTKDGANITVQQYFLEEFDKKLRYPKLNCLHVGPLHKTVYLPMEVCRIAKGQRTKKTSELRMQNMIKATAVPPRERLRQTKEIVQKSNFSQDPYMNAIGFSISDVPLSVKGRVLPAPEVQMSEKVLVKTGKWDPRDQKVFKGGELKRWGVIIYATNFVTKQELINFIERLQKMGNDRNMSIYSPLEVLPMQGPVPKPDVDLTNLKAKYPDIQLIMVVIKRRKPCMERSNVLEISKYMF